MHMKLVTQQMQNVGTKTSKELQLQPVSKNIPNLLRVRIVQPANSRL